MKRTLCLMLALALTLGLLAGCGQGGGESLPADSGAATVPSSEAAPTEPAQPEGPPRLAQELVPRLNAALKAQGIPVEFIRHQNGNGMTRAWNNKTQTWENSRYDLYLPRIDGAGTTDHFDLSVDYRSDPSDPVTKLQIWIASNATDRERELHRQVCQVAALLCDEAMTAELAQELLTAEPSPTQYLRQVGQLSSFTSGEALPEKGWGYPNCATTLCQPKDLTHTYYTELTSGAEFYEVYFTEAGEQLWSERCFTAPSVEELEQRLNAAFAQLGVPVTCQLLPHRNYGEWMASFRYTTMDDPDYVYPEYPYEVYNEKPEDVSKEDVDRYRQIVIHNTVALRVDAIDPLRKDAPVEWISLSDTQYLPQLPQALLLACDPQQGAEDFKTLQDMTPVPGSREGEVCRVLEKGDYTFKREDYTYRDSANVEYTSVCCTVDYNARSFWYTEEPTGEALLDPKLMEYEFMLEGPMVQNGRFLLEQYSENHFGNYSFEDYVPVGDVLDDFLICTRSNVSLNSSYYIDDYGYHFYYGIYAGPYGGDPSAELDRTYFAINDFYSDYVMASMRYNKNVEQYLTADMPQITLENILRVPIALSLLLDDGMPLEDIIRFHTHGMEQDYVATKQDQYLAPEGWLMTVYGTEKLVHVLAEDPASGEHYYYAILRNVAQVDSDLSHLMEHLD